HSYTYNIAYYHIYIRWRAKVQALARSHEIDASLQINASWLCNRAHTRLSLIYYIKLDVYQSIVIILMAEFFGSHTAISGSTVRDPLARARKHSFVLNTQLTLSYDCTSIVIDFMQILFI